jgi:hypothetical protein
LLAEIGTLVAHDRKIIKNVALTTNTFLFTIHSGKLGTVCTQHGTIIPAYPIYLEVVMDPFFPFVYEPEKKNEPEHHLYIEIDPPRYEREEKVEEDEPPRIIIIQL